VSNTSTEPDRPIVGENAPGNTVATIGLILTLVAGLMCGVLFAVVSRLPGSKSVPQSYNLQSTIQPESGDAESLDSQVAPEPHDEDTDSAPEAIDVPLVAEAELVEAKTAVVQLQVLLLTIATAVLNLVGLVLSIAGLFVPNRPRTVAVCGMILALLLFAGVFGVVAVGALLNPVASMISG